MGPLGRLKALFRRGAPSGAEPGLRALAESSVEALVCAGRAGRITLFSRGAERLFGLGAAQAVGRSLSSLVREESREALERLISGDDLGSGRRLELDGLRADGSTFPLELSMTRSGAGEARVIAGVARDLSERRALETALKASEDGLRTLAEAAAAAVFVCQDERVAYANPAASAITGYKHEELIGRPFPELVRPEFRSLLQERALARRRGELGATRYEMTLESKSGAAVWVESSCTTIEQRGRKVEVVMAYDVTDRRLAEDAMRESERRMRDLIENVQLVSVLLDKDGAVTFANQYLLELAGYEEEDVVGRNWFDLFLPEERRSGLKESFLERVRVGVLAPHDEYEIVTARGERRFVSWNNTLLHDPAGGVVGMAFIGADVTERRRAEERLLHDALYDSLTGLPNRALFVDRLGGAVARLRRRPAYLFAVLFLDIDRFKVVNDSLGHLAGDEFLVQVSKQIASALRRPEQTLARMGGDEFAILLDDVKDQRAAMRVVERLYAALAKPLHIAGQELFPSVSIGIAFSAATHQHAEDVLRDADTAMHQAKLAGKGRHQVFDASMHKRVMWQLRVENSLRRAVDRGEFVLHYQPIVSLRDGKVAGFEALVRWHHPERGIVSPCEFIHIAEETGLIFALGRWTLREACRELRSFGPRADALTMSVNLSARQFAQEDLSEQVEAALRESGLLPRQLKLEITESAIMENPEAAVALLKGLKELGTGLSIDDFGTGYSSLSYLVRFPADTLKIDRSFVAVLGSGGRHEPIVEAIVSLARSLEMSVVAEGIETRAQRDALRDLGCGYGQGYLFSVPVDAAGARELLERGPFA